MLVHHFRFVNEAFAGKSWQEGRPHDQRAPACHRPGVASHRQWRPSFFFSCDLSRGQRQKLKLHKINWWQMAGKQSAEITGAGERPRGGAWLRREREKERERTHTRAQADAQREPDCDGGALIRTVCRGYSRCNADQRRALECAGESLLLPPPPLLQPTVSMVTLVSMVTSGWHPQREMRGRKGRR